MRRLILILALLAPVPLHAQENTASLREIRQRASWALSRAENMGEEAEALAEHLRALIEALSVRIGEARSEPEPSGDEPADEPLPPLPQKGLLYSEDFEAVPIGGRVQGRGANGFQWTGGFRTIVASDDHAHSGERSLRFDYPGEVRCEDSTREQRFRLAPEGGAGYSEVWIEYMVHVPENYGHRSDCGAANNKLILLWAEEYGISPASREAAFVVEYNPTRNGAASIAMIGEVAGDDTREGTRGIATIQDILFSPENAGRWIRIRVHFKIAVDGAVEVWRDDQKVGELLDYNTRIEGGRNYVRLGYIFGWSNSGFDEDTTFYVDDFRVWTADPGWTF